MGRAERGQGVRWKPRPRMLHDIQEKGIDVMVLAAVISTVGLLGWLIIGGLAGALAGRVVRGTGFGILGDIIVGCIGGFLGGLLLGLFVNAQVGLIGTFITAFIGACILLYIIRALSGGRGRSRVFR